MFPGADSRPGLEHLRFLLTIVRFRLSSIFLGATLIAPMLVAQTPPVRRAPPPVTSDTTADSTKVAAEPATRPASLFGFVFDSVHMAPLAGATVNLVGTERTTLTTDKGVFKLDSLAAGTYRVRVDHVLLDSIGVQMVTQEFALADGQSETIQLAIPSAGTLVEVSCPAARRALGPSALIGRLLDADSQEPVKGARVSIAWEEISLNANLRRVPRVRDALSADDGVFRICGLPSNLEGTLQAQLGKALTSEVRVRFEGAPLVVQGLKIGFDNTVAVGGDSAVRRQQEAAVGKSFSAATMMRGQASLTGRVTNAAGGPVIGARVDVVGTPGATLTGAGGEFRLDSLPSGTQTVVVRQLGFAPVEQAVELSTRDVARTAVVLSKQATVLATVDVTASADAGLDKVGFSQRKRSGFGHFITGDEVVKRAPNQLTDVFRTIPGLTVVPSGTDYVIQSSRNATGGCVKFWLDGSPFEAVFPGDVDRLIPPWEVAAIEVYNGSSAPVQFQAAGNSSCASVVIWSKTRVNAPTGRPRR